MKDIAGRQGWHVSEFFRDRDLTIETETISRLLLVIGAETAPTLVQLEFLGGRGETPLTPRLF